MMGLFSQKIQFIHIGKCGGSYINDLLSKKISKIHMMKPRMNNSNCKYIIFIRNPLRRFISAFNHSKNLIEFDTTGCTYNNLFNDIKSPYYKLHNKIKSKLKVGHPFNEWNSGEDYITLMNKFKSANCLAEGLSSKNKEIQQNAQLLMRNEEVEHIFKGIGWYLHNGKFIDTNFKRILFVGSIEDINQDIEKLSILLETPLKPDGFQRKNMANYNNTLSKLAINNLLKFYESTDYRALERLYHYGFLNKKLFESYYTL
tara:strand:- start:9820 stop:10593 length:774 start_codon:yes stop_codon:yes gene_type:complete